MSVAAGGAVALAAYRAAWVLARRPGRRRISSLVPVAVALFALLAMTWCQFAWIGTVPGTVSDSGLCPAGNVPGWWPRWIPA
ncbi:hypothetical protein ACIQOW_27945 [Kitasatospora sp. NPDC091335]|uniref:hypothetical protein n=1 Tax=Kitasatospora sp. NPDC091335 TaxID=3364085 RepID=UPI0037FF42FB